MGLVKLMSRKLNECNANWIGEVPEGWEIKPLRAILQERKENNNPIRTDNILSLTIEKGVIPYSDKGNGGNKAKEDLTAYKLAYPDDIVINSMNVIVGAVGLSKYFGAVSPVYYTLFKRNKRDCIEYFNYVFQTGAFQNSLIGLGNGIMVKQSKSSGKLNTIRMRISMSKLNGVMIPYPSYEEQNKIKGYLDIKVAEIDKIINDIQTLLDEYKQYKKSLISDIVTQGLDKSIEMKDSGVAWNKRIPVHWEVVNGKRLFEQRKEKAFEGDKQLTASQKHGVLYQEDFMRIENQKVVLVEKDFSILKHVEPNDFVISMRSFQGGLEYSRLRGCISSAYVMLIPNEKVYAPYFRWLFKSIKYINALQSTSNLVRDGQAMRYSNFVQIPLFILPKEEQKEIADYLDRKCADIDKIIAQKEALLLELEAYKKSLIYECVTGKREVK